MGEHYGHVTIEERCEIARLRSKGRSIRQIAAAPDRSPSTGARELKRNMSRTLGYQPRYADRQARATNIAKRVMDHVTGQHVESKNPAVASS